MQIPGNFPLRSEAKKMNDETADIPQRQNADGFTNFEHYAAQRLALIESLLENILDAIVELQPERR
jgi:hypothetical protein